MPDEQTIAAPQDPLGLESFDLSAARGYLPSRDPDQTLPKELGG